MPSFLLPLVLEAVAVFAFNLNQVGVGASAVERDRGFYCGVEVVHYGVEFVKLVFAGFCVQHLLAKMFELFIVLCFADFNLSGHRSFEVVKLDVVASGFHIVFSFHRWGFVCGTVYMIPPQGGKNNSQNSQRKNSFLCEIDKSVKSECL